MHHCIPSSDALERFPSTVSAIDTGLKLYSNSDSIRDTEG